MFGKKIVTEIMIVTWQEKTDVGQYCKILVMFLKKAWLMLMKGEDESDNGRPPLLVTRAKPKLSLMLSRTQWL